MKKKDVLELKRRLTKNDCTFSRICGCYVDGDGNIVTMFGETFLNLPDEEFYKYLDIAKGIFKGKLKDNMLNLKLSQEAKRENDMQQFLLAMRETGLKNEDVLQAFYERVIDNYDHVGDYLILLYRDAYDVITKTSDNNKIDESEDVYEYILCAICPVNLTAPGLAYSESENAIVNRFRDKVVGAPDTGFLFPAFTDRKEDRDAMLFYTRDAKAPHQELAQGLGCVMQTTATEQREILKTVITEVLGDSDEGIEMYEDFHRVLDEKLEEEAKKELERTEQQKLTLGILEETLEKADTPPSCIEEIVKSYRSAFKETPTIAAVIDEKAVKASHKRDNIEHMKKMLKGAAEEIKILNGGKETELTEKIREVTGV
nr:MAG TPA: protein of unknown function (DUF4317) [Caudoviricetes sp.]